VKKSETPTLKTPSLPVVRASERCGTRPTGDVTNDHVGPDIAVAIGDTLITIDAHTVRQWIDDISTVWTVPDTNRTVVRIGHASVSVQSAIAADESSPNARATKKVFRMFFPSLFRKAPQSSRRSFLTSPPRRNSKTVFVVIRGEYCAVF
jgi:hypothetical protein